MFAEMSEVIVVFEEIFIRKKLNIEKALSFGFVKKEHSYVYETDILNGEFRLKVIISADANVDTSLMEKDTGEEYILYKTSSAGNFVGEIRRNIVDVLQKIAEECYDIEIFKENQTKEVIRYVKEKYDDQLEFLWEKFPDSAICRRRDTKKWYLAILTVTKNKLGIDSDEKVEIVDLRMQPQKLESLLEKEGYYPGWHMNKKHWYTVILDESVPTEELFRHIDESYNLAI